MKSFIKHYLKFLVLTLVVLTLSSCSNVPDLSYKDIKKLQKPKQTLTIYYPVMRYNKKDSYLLAQKISFIKTNNMPKKAIERLVTGQPRKDMVNTFIPVFNPKTRVLGVAIKKKIATVNFNHTFLDGKIVYERQEGFAVAAIVNTMSQFPKVDKVIITVEGKTKGTVRGKKIEDFWGKGILKNQPFSVKANKNKKTKES
ncbi:MAG: hypothetical protein E3J54_05370 [Actinobacteria bacterium]|nr:MAG: hypothetical protein E3J54_05370 [Actinomycetota bacterium]